MTEQRRPDRADELLSAWEDLSARSRPPAPRPATSLARRGIGVVGSVASVVIVVALAVAFGPALVPPRVTSVGPSGTIMVETPATSATLPDSTPSPSVPLPSGAPSPTFPALADQVVRDGDAVTADGRVVLDASGTVYLCSGSGVRPASFDAILACSPPAVKASGLVLEELPGWTREGDRGISSYLTLEGIWAEGTFHVESAMPAATDPPSRYSRRAVPCEEPSDGWPGNAPDASAQEAAGPRLQRAVDSEPDLYSGLWPAWFDLEGPPVAENGVAVDAAMVVGTVGDVASAEQSLGEVYPYNLCVVSVRYSASDLEAVTSRLEPIDGDWQVDAEPAIDGITLWLDLIDEGAVERLGPDADLVQLHPLVRRRPSPAVLNPTASPTLSPEPKTASPTPEPTPQPVETVDGPALPDDLGWVWIAPLSSAPYLDRAWNGSPRSLWAATKRFSLGDSIHRRGLGATSLLLPGTARSRSGSGRASVYPAGSWPRARPLFPWVAGRSPASR